MYLFLVVAVFIFLLWLDDVLGKPYIPKKFKKKGGDKE